MTCCINHKTSLILGFFGISTVLSTTLQVSPKKPTFKSSRPLPSVYSYVIKAPQYRGWTFLWLIVSCQVDMEIEDHSQSSPQTAGISSQYLPSSLLAGDPYLPLTKFCQRHCLDPIQTPNLLAYLCLRTPYFAFLREFLQIRTSGTSPALWVKLFRCHGGQHSTSVLYCQAGYWSTTPWI